MSRDGIQDKPSDYHAMRAAQARLEDHAQSIREQLVALNTALSMQPKPDLSPVKETLREVRDSVSVVRQRVPPIATVIAVAIALTALLGFSYSDISAMRDRVSATTASVTERFVELDELLAAATDLLKELSKDQAALQAATASVNDNLTDNFDKIASLDRLLSRMLTQPTTSSGLATSPANAGSGMPTKAGMAALLEMFGPLPPAMAQLAEAQAALAEGDYTRARTLAVEAKALDPDDTTGVFDFIVASAYLKDGQPREAIRVFEVLIDTYPGDSAFLNGLGAAQFALALESPEDSPERVDLLERTVASQRLALQADPANATARINIAVALNALEQFSEALRVLQEVPAGSPELLFQLAATFALMGRHSQAIDALAQACAIESSQAVLAGIDSDFDSLRDSPAFLELLEKHVDEATLRTLRSTWEADG